MNKIILLILLTLIPSFASVINVTVSILPQKYFINKIAKEKIKVNVMVKPGFSPATYEPQTSQMKLLDKSKVYFYIGVPFENAWLDKFKQTNTNMLIIDTSFGISKIQIEEHDHKENVHHHEELDPHVWLDPMLVKIQAKNIYKTLIKIDMTNKDFYKKNYNDFLNELDVLDKELKELLYPVKEKSFMVFHPSWGYFAKRYNLKQIVVEKEGKTPKLKEIVELIKESKKHNIRAIFVSPQFSQKSANTIAKNINGNTIIVDHLSYLYKANLINMAKQINKSYK